MMRLGFIVVAFLVSLGCSRSRENEFFLLLKEQILVPGSTPIGCWGNRNIRYMLSDYIERAHGSEIEMPFFCYMMLEKKTGAPALGGQWVSPRLLVRWNGIFDQEAVCSQYRGELNFNFTVFMVESNDTVHVLSFEKFRNNANYGGTRGRYFMCCNGNMGLSIWDGVMPDLNHPEEMFDRPYKEVLAVLTERPFNYCYYLSPGRIHTELHNIPDHKKFFLHNRTQTTMTFLPEVLLSCTGFE